MVDQNGPPMGCLILSQSHEWTCYHRAIHGVTLSVLMLILMACLVSLYTADKVQGPNGKATHPGIGKRLVTDKGICTRQISSVKTAKLPQGICQLVPSALIKADQNFILLNGHNKGFLLATTNKNG